LQHAVADSAKGVLDAINRAGAEAFRIAMMVELLRDNRISSTELNQSIGFLLNPLDVPGLAILLSAGPRLAAVGKPAVLGALVAIALRTSAHALLL
jgi:hypothetical protein